VSTVPVYWDALGGHVVLKVLRSRKGLSTVIGTVMMISATMAMGVLAISWAVPTLDLYQSNAGLYYQQRSNALKESFIIEDVWFNLTANPRTIDITLRNVGSIEIKVVALYINGTNYLTGTPMVYVGHRSAPIRITYNWQSGKVYVITVATQRGNQIVSIWGI
jgi:archaellum component FlaF (FlaF/FlaG flagellin family)